MVETTARVLQGRCDVFALQIRVIIEDLCVRLFGGEKVQDVDDADAHAPNARTSAALFGIERNPF